MAGQTDLKLLISQMEPTLNEGEYVFVNINDLEKISRSDTLFEFKEVEGATIVLERQKADLYNLSYDFVASWITLKVHSALEAVGFTAAFSSELTKHKISCNVVAAYFHDHIFVDVKDAERAMKVLKEMKTEV
ncbi:MAG TPA: ACT domain-containing protein [Saprospiraceae bacterium]|nr:ACT domain-containing protein [Saprospiraceae bacterium]HPN68342.1 ACT domain-containing protein [Saprospiraceae bacterium]